MSKVASSRHLSWPARALARLVTPALCALFPPGEVTPGLREGPARRRAAEIFDEAPWLFCVGLVASWLAFWLCPIATIYRPVPASLLSRPSLDRHCDRMSGHSWYWLRQPMLMLKTVGGAMWGEDPEVRRALGLPVYEADPGTWRGDFTLAAPLGTEEGRS